MMEDDARRRKGIAFVLEVLSRRKWLAILTFSGALSAVVGIVMFVPRLYQSTATMVIERQEIPEELVKSTVTSAVETRLQTISEEILSRSRLESLINNFGLYPRLENQVPHEELIERLRGDIKIDLKRVERVGRDQAMVAFSISFIGADAQKVAVVTNALASFYIDENSKVRSRQAVGTAQFLRGQLEEMRRKLDMQEQRVSEFRDRYVGELPQQQEANMATLERLNGQIRANNENQVRLLERQAALEKQLVEAEGYASSAAQIDRRLTELKQRLTELQTRFDHKYPDVIRTKLEIEAIEEQLSRSKGDGENGKQAAVQPTPYVLQLKQATKEADAVIKALKSESAGLQRSSALYMKRIENSPRREQEFEELSRNYEATKEIYNSLLKRQEEAQLAESMEQRLKGEQIRLVDPAVESQRPIAPNRNQLVALGLVFALGLASGAVILAEQTETFFRKSFHTVDDLRAFTVVPVLVSIPHIVTRTEARWRPWRFGLTALSIMLGLMFIVGSSYFVASGNEQLVRLLMRK
jgi:polysaccharide chain length determinant protein (PEP-CTERM system associated)